MDNIQSGTEGVMTNITMRGPVPDSVVFIIVLTNSKKPEKESKIDS